MRICYDRPKEVGANWKGKNTSGNLGDWNTTGINEVYEALSALKSTKLEMVKHSEMF